jgi:hypothetical protein
MSFSTNGQITIQDNTPADVVYSEVQNTGSQCVYADRTRDIGVPRQLIISHQLLGSGDAKRLRSLVKLTNSIENAALEGDVVEARCYIVCDTPLRVVDKATVTDMLTQLENFISSSGFVDQLMNQEV